MFPPTRGVPFWSVIVILLAGCNGGSSTVVAPSAPVASTRQPEPATFPVMLGIDVLESQGFAILKGKKVGLLTHPAGVNRNGERTIDVLRRAPGVSLVALYGPEHGINGDAAASVYVASSTDRRTGLPVHSLFGATRSATPAQLKGIDVMVVDLQDIGTRSYTFISAMKKTMEACFQNGVEVVVLDRPNPLGGLKVSGPLLDAGLNSYVGEFRVPYVHGLTIGELAKMAKEAPGVLQIPEKQRADGKLTVVPMRGWHRSMRWPETGLKFIATSPYVRDFAAVTGYPMTGLGTYYYTNTATKVTLIDIGFRHGVGPDHPFLALTHNTVRPEVLERDLRALNVPGLAFRQVAGKGRDDKPTTAVMVEITDWAAWDPTELNFHLMKLGIRYGGRVNPFKVPKENYDLFLKHMGSVLFLQALQNDGAAIDIAKWLKTWKDQGAIYQTQSKKYWLYQ